MIMSLKQRKIKFKPRIKLKISLSYTSRNKSFSMWNVIQVNCGQKSNVRAVSYFWNSSILIFYILIILGSGLAHLCLHMTELLEQEWYTYIGLDGGWGGGGITPSATTSYQFFKNKNQEQLLLFLFFHHPARRALILFLDFGELQTLYKLSKIFACWACTACCSKDAIFLTQWYSGLS